MRSPFLFTVIFWTLSKVSMGNISRACRKNKQESRSFLQRRWNWRTMQCWAPNSKRWQCVSRIIIMLLRAFLSDGSDPVWTSSKHYLSLSIMNDQSRKFWKPTKRNDNDSLDCFHLSLEVLHKRHSRSNERMTNKENPKNQKLHNQTHHHCFSAWQVETLFESR